MNENRRNFRAINATDDIVGAKADTFLHSIRSNRRVDPNLPNYTALDGQKVDSSAVSVGKSIVFASLIQEHDIVWKRDGDGKDNAPYVVASVGNVGLSGHHNVEKEKGGAARRSTTPTPLSNSGGGPVASSSSRGVAGGGTPGGGSRGGNSSRLTPAEKKQVMSRQEEIRLVRELT